MDAAQQRNGNFQDRNKEVIRGLTDRSITHRCRYSSTRAIGAVYDRAFFPEINEVRAIIDRAYRLPLLGFLLREEEDQVGLRDDIETGTLFHKDRGPLMVHIVGDFVD